MSGAELESLGAIAIDTGDLAWLAEAGWSEYGLKAYTVLSGTRPLLEDVVRRRVQALPGIEIRDGARVVGVHRQTDAPMWEVSLADGSVLDADLVVDLSGRSSRLPVWLKNQGLGDVRVSEVNSHVGYATRTYSMPPDAVEPAGVVILMTPQMLAGGTALPVEGGRWLISAMGAGERRPPRDPAGFEQFLEGLIDPAVTEVATTGEPHGDVHLHRQTGNRRHHYERLRQWPPGLLVVGDALCAFNPIHGQGITVAACQAVVLRGSLRNGASPTALRRLAAHGDDRAALAMARVYHLMASPVVMAHPALLVASIRMRLRGAGPSNPRPPIRRAPA